MLVSDHLRPRTFDDVTIEKAKDWLQRFEHWTKYRRYNDEEASVAAPLMLLGGAESLFQVLPNGRKTHLITLKLLLKPKTMTQPSRNGNELATCGKKYRCTSNRLRLWNWSSRETSWYRRWYSNPAHHSQRIKTKKSDILCFNTKSLNLTISANGLASSRRPNQKHQLPTSTINCK